MGKLFHATDLKYYLDGKEYKLNDSFSYSLEPLTEAEKVNPGFNELPFNKTFQIEGEITSVGFSGALFMTGNWLKAIEHYLTQKLGFDVEIFTPVQKQYLNYINPLLGNLEAPTFSVSIGGRAENIEMVLVPTEPKYRYHF